MNLFTSLIVALRYYLQIKATAADYELTQRIENDIREIEGSIAALRARGDPDAQRLADQLRQRLLRTQGVAIALSAARPAPVAASAPDDQGRPLLPPNG